MLGYALKRCLLIALVLLPVAGASAQSSLAFLGAWSICSQSGNPLPGGAAWPTITPTSTPSNTPAEPPGGGGGGGGGGPGATGTPTPPGGPGDGGGQTATPTPTPTPPENEVAVQVFIDNTPVPEMGVWLKGSSHSSATPVAMTDTMGIASRPMWQSDTVTIQSDLAAIAFTPMTMPVNEAVEKSPLRVDAKRMIEPVSICRHYETASGNASKLEEYLSFYAFSWLSEPTHIRFNQKHNAVVGPKDFLTLTQAPESYPSGSSYFMIPMRDFRGLVGPGQCVEGGWKILNKHSSFTCKSGDLQPDVPLCASQAGIESKLSFSLQQSSKKGATLNFEIQTPLALTTCQLYVLGGEGPTPLTTKFVTLGKIEAGTNTKVLVTLAKFRQLIMAPKKVKAKKKKKKLPQKKTFVYSVAICPYEGLQVASNPQTMKTARKRALLTKRWFKKLSSELNRLS